MSEAERINVLKRECLRLFELRSDYKRYDKEAIELAERVVNLKLNHTIDPGQLQFYLLKLVYGDISRDQFNKLIEDFFKVKKTDYYFQLSELEAFSDNYQLGYGVLLTFDLLPQPVRAFAEGLAKGEIINDEPKREQILKKIVRKLVIPPDPCIGYWLKITKSSISYTIRLDNAFVSAEESLDILRIATPTSRVRLPQYAIGMNSNEKQAFLATAAVTFSRYPYAPRKQELIERLSKICVKPSSELEERIKDALHFYRIGDNHSPDHQKLFFYVAAIERLIISDKTDLTHKFSEKGAILLANNLKDRLELSEKLKEIYKKRSSIAHGGKSKYDFFMTIDARRYLHDIIMKILYLIDTCGLQTVSSKKKKPGRSLDEYLDNIIFSG